MRKVSVLCPTYNRPGFMQQLYNNYTAQTYPARELLILDDSPEPAALMQALTERDATVQYFHHPDRLSIGAKRNLLAERAQGDIIAHFDDDDYYGPEYLSTMVEALGDDDLVKLDSWFVYSCQDDVLGYWDTKVNSATHFVISCRERPAPINLGPTVDESKTWGYAFSYVYTHTAWKSVRYNDMNHGEDYDFTTRVRAAGARARTFADERGIAACTAHRANNTRFFPQYSVPHFLRRQLFGDQLAFFERLDPRR